MHGAVLSWVIVGGLTCKGVKGCGARHQVVTQRKGEVQLALCKLRPAHLAPRLDPKQRRRPPPP